MDRKDHKKVKKIPKNISTTDLKDRICRLCKDVQRPLGPKDEVEVYRHIGTLKEECTEEYDNPNLIYKVFCSQLNLDEPGLFVFKTSKTSLEIAAKMSGTKKANADGSE